MIQTIIAVLSGTAIYLTQQKNNKLKKYAPIVGMISQPFWIYSTFIAEQWGMLVLSIVYIYFWGLGIYNSFFVKE